MKITNDPLRSLQEAELQKLRSQTQSSDFTDILNRQMEASQTAGAAVGSASLHSLERQIPVNAVMADTPVASRQGEAAAKMQQMLTGIEQYAQQLGSGPEQLKSAYAQLQDVSKQIAGFKEEYPNAGDEMPEMASLLNELDVLATTESFKLNRGDYL